MGTVLPRYSPINELTPQEFPDPLRFKSMAGFTRSLDSSEGESPEHSPSRTSECNEKPIKRRASRAGTRSVSTLTPAQLSRKRANDREAQRAIRQRTKEHIEKLELRIAELEGCGDNSSSARFDEVLLRNAVLERQIAQLARQLQLTCGPFSYGTQSQYDQSDISPVSQWQSNTFGSATTEPILKCEPSNGFINPGITSSPYSPTPMHMPLTPDTNSTFMDGSGMCSMGGTPTDIGSPSDWTNMSTTMEQNNSSCASFPRSVPNFPLSSPTSTRSSLFRQPAMFSWEIPSKLAPATTPFDSLLLSLLQSQRTMAMNGMPRPQVLGPSYPNMKALIYDDPETQNSTHPVSKVISDILRNTLVINLPERAASFFLMYYLLQWEISPSPETYKNVPEWAQPRPSQHVTSHAIWVDAIPWPKLREKIIDNQELYETEDFQQVLSASLNLNWPYRDLDVLEVVDDGGSRGGEVRISEQFQRHLLNLGNWSLDKGFSRRFPELADSCRFTEGKEGSGEPRGGL